MRVNFNYFPVAGVVAALSYQAVFYEADNFYFSSNQITPYCKCQANPSVGGNGIHFISAIATGSTTSGSTVILCDVSNAFGSPYFDGGVTDPIQPDIEQYWKSSEREPLSHNYSNELNSNKIYGQHILKPVNRRYPRKR